MLLGLSYLMLIFCFFMIAINIFVVYVEFAIFASVALILVPFGVWEKTEFIFDKVKNGVINFGIKYMTLAFVVSISFNIIKQWQLPPDPTFQQALYVLLGMLAVTYLCWHAPSVAAGMASGGGGMITAAAMVGAGSTMANNAASTAGGTGKALVGGVNQATGNRGGIIPTVGRMTGVTTAMVNAASTVANMGKDFMNSQGKGGSSSPTPPTSTSSNVSPQPVNTASGVDLNTGPSNDISSASLSTTASNANPGMEWHKANNTSSATNTTPTNDLK
jgi:type IV secretion system protein TrbL